MLRVASLMAALVMLLSSPTLVRAAAPFPVSATLDFAQSRVLFAETNAARTSAGLQALAHDRLLDSLAAEQAQEMVRQGYLGHTSPSGVTFQQRVRAAGIRYSFAAENVATAADAQQAQDALVRSPEHYANIVNPRVRKLGTAAVPAGDGKVYFVQEFAD